MIWIEVTMEFKELLQKRRCVRQYTGGGIPMNHLKLILNAGLRAPNACNFQSWHFYCICDSEKITGLVPTVCRFEWMKNASAVIVICTDSARLEERFGDRGTMFAVQDTAAAAENMLLQATDLGYGGCWVGAFSEDACSTYLHLPQNHRPVIILPLGTYEENPEIRERAPFDEAVTFIGDAEDSSTEEKPFTLHSASLPRAVFDDLYLGEAQFNNICLTNGHFSDMNFTGSRFGGLCMNEVSFGCVDMRDAEFENVDFTGASFKNCTFDKITVDGASGSLSKKEN